MSKRGFTLWVVALFAAGSTALGTIGAGVSGAKPSGGATAPKTGQVCATPAGGALQCFAPPADPNPIQAGIDYAGTNGPGGDVNIGPGTFTEHVTLAHGVTIRGQGSRSTIWAATIDGSSSLSIIRAYNSSGFDGNIVVKNIRFRAKYAGSGYGFVVTLKDGNPANKHTFTNNLFDLYDDRCNAVAIWSYNSYASLEITNNTFTDIMQSVLIESSAGAGQLRRTPALIDNNLFYRQSKTTHGRGSTGVEINLAAASGAVAATQTITNNQYNFAWENAGETSYAVVIDGDGGTDTTSGQPDDTVIARNNNFKQVDWGFSVGLPGQSPNPSADAGGNWWGCATGPNTGTCAKATTPSPTITSFLTKSLSLHAGVQ